MERGQALIVGASSEIGAAIAAAVVPYASSLTLWGRGQARLDAAAAGCSGVPVSTRIVHVTNDEAMTAGLAELRGGEPLRIIIWAAGAFDWGPADEADPQRWRSVTEVNLTAPAVLTALALPDLVAAAPSALIYLGSGADHVIYPNNAAYVASKHGLAALARATYLDVRPHRVKVCLISPGLVNAGATLGMTMPDAQRDALLQPADVASGVAYVLGFPDHGCPTEIRLQPHQLPQ